MLSGTGIDGDLEHPSAGSRVPGASTLRRRPGELGLGFIVISSACVFSCRIFHLVSGVPGASTLTAGNQNEADFSAYLRGERDGAGRFDDHHMGEPVAGDRGDSAGLHGDIRRDLGRHPDILGFDEPHCRIVKRI